MNETTTLVEISGNTFPVKEALKRLGARWNGAKKCWVVTADKAEAALALVQGRKPTTLPVPALAGNVDWSDEQTAIFSWFATGTGNMVVQARAGTGKTTTIKEAFNHAPEAGRLLYAVFNKKNQVEAQEKITDARVEVKTLHSLGYSFIKRVWTDAKPEDAVEFDRIERVSPGLPEEITTQVVKLVGFCKNTFVTVPSLNEVLELADARNICAPDEMDSAFPVAKLAALAIDVLRVSLEKDAMGARISFNDMVWLPVAAGWVKPTFSLVVVDEAQDMNMPQLLMAERACKAGGRICIVGDDRQAIYGFRGAASDGMHLMKQRLNAGTLGLTTTYRCPKTVVALANTIVADYTAAPSAPEGEVLDMTLSAAVNTLVVGDAVLSRLNAPLMNICLSLIRKGTPARVEGRDIGQQLVGMVRKLKAKSVPDFLRKLEAWGDKQVARARAAGGKFVQSKVELAQDQVATLTAVAEGCANVAQVEARITEIFQDSAGNRTPAVVCSSVHKAKGLEWNRVCLVSSTFKHATADASSEEANIFYVAVTRAKKTLIRGV
jgi:hypothetical protein